MSVITCPEFTNLDLEIIGDFRSCLQENIEDIEICINKLDESEDPDLIHELFRAMHSFKGNCRMVLLTPFVDVTHHLEELVSEMREGKRIYHHLYGSFLVTSILLLEELINTLAADGQCDSMVINLITEEVERLNKVDETSNGDDIELLEQIVARLVLLDKDAEGSVKADSESITTSAEAPICGQQSEYDSASALNFFGQLAMQLDNLTIYRHGRTDEMLRLSLAMNQKLSQPIDEQQLSAAVFIHDIGMAFVPHTVINKASDLSREEKRMILAHVDTGSQMLACIPGWEEAALIVEQHHERHDGKGYPGRLEKDAIHPGAMIIALADTYFAVTNERSDRSYKKSLFSAVKLINNEAGRQFSTQLVDVFNDSVRELYIG